MEVPDVVAVEVGVVETVVVAEVVGVVSAHPCSEPSLAASINELKSAVIR